MTRSTAYAVELDGQYLVGRKGELQRVDNLRNLKGDCFLFTDLQGAVSRTMAVEADFRYAELMLSRKLQETGEFDEPVFIITHWKKKRGKSMTDICFTAVPSKRYVQYLDQVGQHDAHLVVMPLQSVLWEVLRKRARNQPAAVVFQHDRFADLMIGTGRKVWYAGRTVAFDHGEEQIRSLWDSVRNDIRTVADEYNQTVGTLFVITWIDSVAPPQWPDEEDLSLVRLDTREVTCDGQSFQVSLPGLIQAGKASPVLAPFREKLLYGARRVLPYVNIFLIIIALACLLAGGWYQRKGSGLARERDQMLARAAQITTRLPAGADPVVFEPTLGLLDQLWASRRLPTYNQVLHDFSLGLNTTIQLKDIKAEYQDAKVEVSAFGIINEPFEVSYKAYRDLLNQVQRRGYRIIEQRFDTRVQDSDFSLRLVKEAR